jgi:hypothetical protein
LEFQKRFPVPRTQAGHGAAQLHDAAAIAAVANHLIDARAAEPWMLFQCEANERGIGIDNERSQWLRAFEPLAFDGVANSVGMDAQLTGDGADFPVLGLKVAPDLSTDFWADHERSHLRLGMRG